MKHFTVTVNNGTKKFQYPAIAESSLDCLLSALEIFGICSVSVRAT